MSPLNRELGEQLPWLFKDLRFRVIEDEYSPKAFGDCLVVLDSDVLKLRFARDRGQVTVDVAPHGGKTGGAWSCYWKRSMARHGNQVSI
jgi:hypothetical protein